MNVKFYQATFCKQSLNLFFNLGINNQCLETKPNLTKKEPDLPRETRGFDSNLALSRSGT